MTSNPPSPPPNTLWYTRCPVPTASGIAIQNSWLARRKDFLLHWGFIPNDVDVRAWADPGPLQRARALRKERTA